MLAPPPPLPVQERKAVEVFQMQTENAEVKPHGKQNHQRKRNVRHVTSIEPYYDGIFS